MTIEKTGDKVIITLHDYKNRQKVVKLDLREVDLIIYVEASGDQCIDVYYKDKTSAWFDSSDSRLLSYFDDMYPIYCNGEFVKCEVEEI